MNIPVAFWLLTSFVRRIPIEIEEAARMEGAGYARTLVQFVLPLLLPGIVSTAIICFILCYNELLFAAFLAQRQEIQTLPVGLAFFTGDKQLRYGQMAVASIVGVTPLYFLATFFQRWLVSGLTSGTGK
jgi:multiple sugar transport system permease protein